MAAPPAKGGGKTGGKGPKASRLYVITGTSITRKNKSCPKCGQGFFMAMHKDRTYCGRCHYTEFVKK